MPSKEALPQWPVRPMPASAASCFLTVLNVGVALLALPANRQCPLSNSAHRDGTEAFGWSRVSGKSRSGTLLTSQQAPTDGGLQGTWLAVDVDGTIADGHGVPWLTRQVLGSARKAGAWVILASGRRPSYLRALAATCRLESPLVALDGAWVEDASGVLFSRTTISATQLDALERVAWHYGLQVFPVTEQDCCLKVLLVGEADASSAAVASLPMGTRAVNRFLRQTEIVAERVSKGYGFLRLFERYGRPRRMVAFGNDWNDREMFEVADTAYALPSAPPAVQALADAVLEPIATQPVARMVDHLIHPLKDPS